MIICPICHAQSFRTLICNHLFADTEIDFVYDSHHEFNLDIKCADLHISIGMMLIGYPETTLSYFTWASRDRNYSLEISPFDYCESLDMINRYLKLNCFT